MKGYFDFQKRMMEWRGREREGKKRSCLKMIFKDDS